jgi:hypothetical protein
MFTLNDMRAFLRARPFMPFCLWLSGGHVNVRSPEQVLPGRQYAIIGLIDPNTLEESFDQHMVVWYMHVTRFQAVTRGASPMSSPGELPPDSPTHGSGS